MLGKRGDSTYSFIYLGQVSRSIIRLRAKLISGIEALPNIEVIRDISAKCEIPRLPRSVSLFGRLRLARVRYEA